MRFYVNDQMVDFDKPITVLINGKVRFEGMVKPERGRDAEGPTLPRPRLAILHRA